MLIPSLALALNPNPNSQQWRAENDVRNFESFECSTEIASRKASLFVRCNGLFDFVYRLLSIEPLL